jgi:hypothetical protein
MDEVSTRPSPPRLLLKLYLTRASELKAQSDHIGPSDFSIPVAAPVFQAMNTQLGALPRLPVLALGVLIFFMILLPNLLLLIGRAWRRGTATDMCHPEKSVELVLTSIGE